MPSSSLMEISRLGLLLNNILSLSELSSCENINSELIQKYFIKAEEILKLLKPILDAIVDSAVASDEVLNRTFNEFGRIVEELQGLFRNWQPLSSKVHFVLQIESMLSKVQASGLDTLELLKSFDQHLPDELNLPSLEHCVQKIKCFEYDQISAVIEKVVRIQIEGIEPSSEVLVTIAESLNLRSNQEILIDAVALEKLKENAEQAERTEEAEYLDQLIALVIRLHDYLVMMKRSQSCSPVPIPTDFCCPLSLELMTDPVIVASGQTYERAYIRNWLDLGLNVCPKTRQTLAHTNLIPNYTVKALIASWCESNNVKPPDPMKSLSINQSSHLSHPGTAVSTELHILPNSIQNLSMSPESDRSVNSAGIYRISSGEMHSEVTSSFHPHSILEGSFTKVAGSGHDLDLRKLSLVSSEDRSAKPGERMLDSFGHSSMPTYREGSSYIDQHLSQRLNRTTSDSSATSSSGEVSDVSKTSTHLTAYSSDPSGEARSDSQAATTMSCPPGETQLPSRLEPRSRSHTIWRRPSERFVPRVASLPAVETRADLTGVEVRVCKLTEDLKSPLVETQREATAELRLLARYDNDNRIVIANCGAIGLLVKLLSSSDIKTQENAVTALLNLSINDNNKTAIANADAIEPLIHVLERGSPEAKENSAAALYSLSVIEENKIKIGRSGAIGPLVDLLGNGTPRGKRDAATALFNLSICHENKVRVAQAGAVKHLVELMDPARGMVDKGVAVLANLSTIAEGRTGIANEGGIPYLVEVIELGSPRAKENAAAALLQLCTNSNRYCSLVLQEGAVPPLMALSRTGTPRAKEKAMALLNCFRNIRHGNAGRG